MTITASFSGAGSTVTTAALYQWDVGQKLKITGISSITGTVQVHFASGSMEQAIVKEATSESNYYLVDIPNEFLQYGGAANGKAWFYVSTGTDEGSTLKTIYIPITPRTRPNDYVSPDDPDSRGIVDQAIELLENYQDDIAAKLNTKSATFDTGTASEPNVDQATDWNAIYKVYRPGGIDDGWILFCGRLNVSDGAHVAQVHFNHSGAPKYRTGTVATVSGEKVVDWSGSNWEVLADADAVDALERGLDVVQTDMGVLVSNVPTLSKTNGKYLKTDGTIGDVDNNAWKVTDYIDVAGYTQAIVTGSATSSNLLCAFYDTGHHFISGVAGEGAATSDKSVDIPYDAKYLVIAENAWAPSSCTLTKWRYTQIAELRTGYREFTTVWEQGEITSSGTILYNQYPARTGWLSTEAFDYLRRTDAITEGMIYYYDYDETQETYAFKSWYKLTPGVNHVIDKSFTHFRLKLFIDWSTVVDLTTAKSSLKLYQYQTAASAPVWFGKKWAAIGDSLTEINSTANAKYHDLISECTGITVVNLGVGGTGYKATNGGQADSFMERVASVPLDADVVTIFGSGNDLGSENEIGTPTDTGTTTLCGCINTAIDSLLTRMPLVNLGIITPTPWQQYNPATSGNRMLIYSTAIVEICRRRGIPCLDLYHCSGLRPWDNTFKGLAYANADGVHPNNKGHALIAPRIEAFLDSLLPGTRAGEALNS